MGSTRTRLTRPGFVSSLVVALATLAAVATAQETGGDMPPPAQLLSVRPMLVSVEFEGNDESDLNDRVLRAQIKSKPTERPGVRRIFGIFATLYNQPLMPRAARNRVNAIVDSLSGEVRYFNPRNLPADTAALRAVYNEFGFHDARFRYRVQIDTARNRARIIFHIDEGRRYPIEGLYYAGVEDVPAHITEKFLPPANFDFGDDFRARDLIAEAGRVAALLQNEGYAFAAHTGEIVLQIRDSSANRYYDSALVSIYTGGRYRFGTTTYLPDSESVRKLKPETVLRQIEYQPGDWYSRQNVDQTVSNLYALGVFEYVRLDSMREGSTDDTLAMQLATVLRNPVDILLNPELTVERRLQGSKWFLGTSATYSHANLFGGAEKLTLQGRVRTPISGGIGAEWSGGISASYLEPTLLGKRRLLGQITASGDYAIEDLLVSPVKGGDDVPLISVRVSLAPEITYRFPRYTFFSTINGRLALQWLRYSNVGRYIDELSSRQVEAAYNGRDPLNETDCPRDETLESVRKELRNSIYREQVWLGDDPNLVDNDYVRQNFRKLKFSLVASGGATGDKRNDFFAPSAGYFADARTELGTTGFINGWAKGEVDYRRYFTSGEGAVVAVRGHAGGIVPFGGITLVPTSSRFWAGGANSLRGWGPRQMLVTRPPNVENGCAQQLLSSLLERARNLIGGLVLVELMSDYRWRPFRLPGVSTLQQQINQLMLIPSLDAGGAFFRDYSDVSGKSLGGIVKYVVSNSGVSVGLALGYDTPIGPIRVGVGMPIWDPVNHRYDPELDPGQPDERGIWSHRFNLRDWSWYFAIGHAF